MASVSRHALSFVLGVAAAMQPAVLRAQASETVPAPALPQAIELDPEAPLDMMPDLGLDWPDPTAPDPAPESVEPIPAPVAAAPATASDVPAADLSFDAEAEHRYTVQLAGLESIDADRIRIRFDALSTLRQGEGEGANMAQIDRRAQEDQRLLRELLHAEGYYAALVTTRVEPVSAGRVRVLLRVDPGPVYAFTEIRINGLEGTGDQATELRTTFFMIEGDPVNATFVDAATENLRQRIADAGFPFAKVGEPEITIDHVDRSVKLSLAVEAGPQARFGAIELRGNPPFNARHVARIARFHTGEPYKGSDLDDLRRALIATGLVSSVSIAPVATADPGVVNVAVSLERAPPRTIAAEFGYGTGEGWRLAGSWTHRNLLKPEGAVTFRGVAGTREQFLGTSLRRSNFLKRDQTLTGNVSLSHLNRNAYDARTFTLGAGIERQSNIIWQKEWAWSAGAELVTTDERDTVAATGEARRRTFYIAALPGSLAYDGSDSLLDPTRGFRLAGRLSPEVSFHSGTFTYARAQIDFSAYQPFGRNFVLAGRGRLGTIVGASRDQIAPSRRYYAGGGGSVRGYGYQDIGPRDVDNNPIGGRSITEFSIEGRMRWGDFGGVAFLDGGNIYTSPLPRLGGLQLGAGLGVRYYSSFGPIRVDVGTPLNRRPGDARVAVYVSLGQAF